MQTTTKEKVTFLKEWTPKQFKAIEKKIATHFSGKAMNTLHGKYPAMYLNFVALDDRLGLAYTSSSSYAGYWICNTEVKSNQHPEYKYVGFAIGKDDKYYAVLQDKDENELIVEL